ncbi:MAG TPA: hypothetical protein VFQ56_06360, partial [Flavobacterium sp.]|nr:hypothetical protein [Flavobacterium sp.]
MLDTISPEILEKYQGEAISAEKEINEKVSKALKNPYASRRWFWELLQNAVDTISDESNRKVNVKIELKQSNLGPVLTFSHDGNPFRKSKKKYRFDDFKNLINPTSGKAQEDDTTIGKFGTGFLSTHVLSLRIDVRGIFEVSDSEKIPLSTTLDRTGFILETEDARAKRIESLVISLDAYEKSKSVRGIVDGHPNAEFTYYLDINNLDEGQSTMHYVQEGLKEIEHSLPLVFAFNKKIESIQIVDTLNGNLTTTRYKNQENNERIGQKIDVHITEKVVDGEKPINFYVGVLKNDEVEVAWRLNETKNSKYGYEALDSRTLYFKDLGQEMAGLYSTFPLVGSHSFKFPLVINSNKFKPNETRDGISLIKTDDYNKRLIEQAIVLYEEYLTVASAHIASIYKICDTRHQVLADHIWIEKEWYDIKIDEIRTVILTAPIVSVTNVENRVAIQSNEKTQQIWFPRLRLEVDVKKEWNDSFYD